MNVSEPTTPPDQIIAKFAAKETEFQDALNHYTYRRVARVQTVDDDNKVDGEWYRSGRCVIFDLEIFHRTGEGRIRSRKAPCSGS